MLRYIDAPLLSPPIFLPTLLIVLAALAVVQPARRPQARRKSFGSGLVGAETGSRRPGRPDHHEGRKDP